MIAVINKLRQKLFTVEVICFQLWTFPCYSNIFRLLTLQVVSNQQTLNIMKFTIIYSHIFLFLHTLLHSCNAHQKESAHFSVGQHQLVCKPYWPWPWSTLSFSQTDLTPLCSICIIVWSKPLHSRSLLFHLRLYPHLISPTCIRYFKFF